jgi:crotonobetainyl-CoA:carnitine CoA-transferase CaiB-like acyl-CoA transferase
VSPPLTGVRVVAIEQYGAGPFGTMQLADLGAEVVKIEDPMAGGDVGRYVPPFQEGEHSLFFESFNRNKRSITLDLRVPEARPLFERLITGADIVFSNLRGDLPDKLRIRYTDLRHVNPRIVCVSLSGFGTSGPRRHQPAYDHTIQALAGWQSMTGEPGGPPVRSALPLVDLAAGYVAALTMVANVYAARERGVGCDADLSLFETALAQLSYIGTWAASRGYEPVRRTHSSHQSIVPFQSFRALDGWLVVACPKDTLWRRLCTAIGRDDMADDLRYRTFADRDRNRDTLVRELAEILQAQSVQDWCELFDAAGVPAAGVNDVSDALDDPQAVARSAVVETKHPVLGSVRQVRSPFDPSSTRAVGRAPYLGEHNEVVLDELGVTTAEIEQLEHAGVFGRPAVGVSGG